MSKQRGHRIAENLIGRTFNRLTVRSRVESEPNRCVRWWAECICGTFVVVRTTSLKSGGTKSCGCWRKESRMLQAGLSMRRQLLKTYQLAAARRGYEWVISDDTFLALTQATCYYCGIEPSSVKRSKRSNGSFIYNGVDRMDNKLGYTESNAVTCCSTCNFAKRTKTHDEFIAYLRRAGTYQLSKQERSMAHAV